jgi:hypothetical protein
MTMSERTVSVYLLDGARSATPPLTTSQARRCYGSMPYTPTEKELRQLLATVLTSATGKAETVWVTKLGTVRPVPPTTDPRSKWKLTGSVASAGDIKAIEKAVAVIRAEHPYVRS